MAQSAAAQGQADMQSGTRAVPQAATPALSQPHLTSLTRPVLVIGASGYLGRHVVQSLTAAGAPVLGAARGLHAPPQHSPNLLAADMAVAATAAQALAQADIVINCAHGGMQATRRLAANLALWLAQSPQRRLIHVSSLAVFGQTLGCLSEDGTPIPGLLHPYGAAKLAAERILCTLAQAGGACLILRFGCLYGPGGEAWFDRIARLLIAGRLGDLGEHAQGACTLLAVQDAAAAITQAALAPLPRQGIVHVLHPAALRWNAYFARIAHALGLPGLTPVGSARLWAETWALAPALRAYARLSRQAPDAITPAMAALFRSRAHFISRAQPLLTPGQFTPHPMVIEAAARDFAARHLVERAALPVSGWPA